MHIEEQRWAPVAARCTPALMPVEVSGTGVGWLHGPPSSPEDGSVDFGFRFDQGDYFYWCYLALACTEFASYLPTFHTLEEDPTGAVPGTINDGLATASEGKAARLIDMKYLVLNIEAGVPAFRLSAIVVPNYGPAARKWWWSGSGGATAAQLTDVINGKAWGPFKHDNIKKRLVSLDRSPLDGKFRFVLNEWKGEAWWWGHGASVDNIKSVINGEAWAKVPKDGIEKRLVSLKRYAKGNWTFLMVPRNGLGWSWHRKISIPDLLTYAKQYNERAISIHYLDPSNKADYVSAVLVQNA
jgi:hypothetical protein